MYAQVKTNFDLSDQFLRLDNHPLRRKDYRYEDTEISSWFHRF